jgi:hypothetical protein
MRGILLIAAGWAKAVSRCPFGLWPMEYPVVKMETAITDLGS